MLAAVAAKPTHSTLTTLTLLFEAPVLGGSRVSVRGYRASLQLYFFFFSLLRTGAGRRLQLSLREGAQFECFSLQTATNKPPDLVPALA